MLGYGMDINDLEKFESLMGNIIGGVQICEFDDNFTIRYVNDGFTQITGYSLADLNDMGSSHLSLVAPMDSWMAAETRRQLDESGKLHVEYRLRRKDGEIIWVLDNGVIFGADDRRLVQCIITDITEQKKREEDLIISDKRYEIALSFTDLTIFDYNVVTKRMINHHRDLADYKVPKVMDNAVESFISSGIISPQSVEEFREMYRRIEEGAPFSSSIVHAVDTNGKENVLNISLTTIFDSDGRPARAVGVKRNITETRRLQRESEYGSTFTFERSLALEANLTRNRIMSIDQAFSDERDLGGITSYTGLIDLMQESIVAPEHMAMFRNQMSPKNIEAVFESGTPMFRFEYLEKQKSGKYIWMEATINIIRDDISGAIDIRFHQTNINEQKQREIHVLDEQRFHDSMSKRSMAVYETNITQNKAISGHESWDKLFGIKQSDNYTDMTNAFVKQAIYPDDRESYLTAYKRENILETFSKGITEIKCEYRRPNSAGETIWVRCIMHLFESTQTGDVCGFSYIENINSEKKKELELIYKSEHDLLTNFFNKETTRERIDAFLATSAAKFSKHAFFILDIDHFKTINDIFGHAFGDVILSQVATKIAELFRADDICGRIGGDEFVVFMRNISNEKIALSKAQEICEYIAESYTQNGIEHRVTLSVGIAFYGEHGTMYNQLYRNSDAALYTSKEQGRNCYNVYSESMNPSNMSPKEIDRSILLEPKSFANNIDEYVFRILYEAQNQETAINSVLALVGKHYHVSRAYIFEDFANGKFTRNTYEWCNRGIVPQIDDLQALPTDEIDNHSNKFGVDGIYYLPDISKATDSVRAILEPQGIKSMLHFSLKRKGEYFGFIGFDECSFVRLPSPGEVSELRTISNILGTFVSQMRAAEAAESMKNMALSIVNGLDSYAYVCNPKTYEVLFINLSTNIVVPTATVGKRCYKEFWDRDEPCINCPMRELVARDNISRGISTYSMDMFNHVLNLHVHATASYIDWGKERACLVNSVDISRYITIV